MDVTNVLDQYPIPLSVVTTIVILWSLNKYIFPNLPVLKKVFTANKEHEIKELKERLSNLEDACNEIKEKLENTSKRENRLLGLISGLSLQLKPLGIDIQPEVDKVLNI